METENTKSSKWLESFVQFSDQMLRHSLSASPSLTFSDVLRLKGLSEWELISVNSWPFLKIRRVSAEEHPRFNQNLIHI